ncbi:MAG TPA: GDP-mannose 4,6-dehydratase, partial [Maribacter sp.]|nr:GDP-mannose 4,6-dehydratase [Maribacter sp.]
MKKALITGINGQDGSYLAEHLLAQGYEVHGIVKRNSVSANQTARIQNIFPKIRDNLYYGDLLDYSSLFRAFQKSKPDEVYNLAAQSHVRISFDEPSYTLDTIAKGTLNILEVVRSSFPQTKVYQASSSEMFGNSIDSDGYQRETTPMNPVSPYACAKLCAYNLSRCYRESYGLFISNGILFNHESPRRGENFVTNKVVIGAVRIKKGLQKYLELGNLDATRDWGHAKDYTRVMQEILQMDKPGDFVCATGKSHSIRDLCDYTFKKLGMNYKDYVVQNERYMRPNELHDLKGDTSHLASVMNFNLEYTFETMLDE